MHTEWPPREDGVLAMEGPRGGFKDGRGPCGSQAGKVLHRGMWDVMYGWVNGGGMLSGRKEGGPPQPREVHGVRLG
jgi:hypothetical protein